MLWVVVGLFAVMLFAGCGPRSRPENFAILFETGNGERIDTFESLVTKDLVGARDTTIQWTLSPAELDTLHALVESYAVLGFPEPHPDAQARGFVPSTPMHLRIRSGGRTRDFRWENLGPTSKSERQWEGLFRLIGTARRMAYRHPEYQALPEPVGAYL